MKDKVQSSKRILCGIATCTLFVSWAGVSRGGETCPANSSGPNICVAFDGDTPEINQDFTVDYATDPANPSVTLRAGNLTWNVRSDDGGSPGNIGDIILDPSSDADNFNVTIASGASAGAVNVGSLALNPGGTWTGYSSIGSASKISGDLTGDMELVDNWVGGGSANGFTIEGNATGAITLPHGEGFTIAGAFAPPSHTVIMDVDAITNGTLRMGEVRAATIQVGPMSNAVLQVDGDVGGVGAAPQCTFWISSMASNSSVRVAYNLAPGAETVEAAVVLSSSLPSGCTLDFANARVDDGTFVIGLPPKTLKGTLLAYELTSVTQFLGGDVAGTVNVTGDVGTTSFWIQGDLLSSGSIVIGGNATTSGAFIIDGDLNGDIQVAGDLDAAISIDGKLGSTGRILVDGLGTGDVSIGTETEALSLIRMTEGLGSTGSVTVNAGGGSYDANGLMHFGSTGGFPLGPVTFDGIVLVDGDLNGDIVVMGCHSPADILDICVCGSVNGRVKIVDTFCNPQVPPPGYACAPGNCP